MSSMVVPLGGGLGVGGGAGAGGGVGVGEVGGVGAGAGPGGVVAGGETGRETGGGALFAVAPWPPQLARANIIVACMTVTPNLLLRRCPIFPPPKVQKCESPGKSWHSMFIGLFVLPNVPIAISIAMSATKLMNRHGYQAFFLTLGMNMKLTLIGG